LVLSFSEGATFPRNTDHISTEEIGWHLIALFVTDFKVEFVHGLLQSVQGTSVNFTQVGQWFVVSEEHKMSSS
jgi:hypothetical protein